MDRIARGVASRNRNALRHPFEQRPVEIRKRVKAEPFDWYRFDSFANVTHFESLLPLALAGDEPVADIGAGDGDIALQLESLGCRVTAIDWPGVNVEAVSCHPPARWLAQTRV
ncbi:MAG TPA: hypothetical protein VHB50_01100 [Bryobacteraceae bacterium]|nr:hypothetical protein [Bryobacteraceae bacterium]